MSSILRDGVAAAFYAYCRTGTHGLLAFVPVGLLSAPRLSGGAWPPARLR